MSAPLAESLRLESRELIALVGGGGKTTLMFRLAHELAAQGKKVVTGTTTKIAAPRFPGEFSLELQETGDRFFDRVFRRLEEDGSITIGRAITSPPNKVAGCDPEVFDELFGDSRIDYVIVEADGARRKPLKAPREREPVIPARATAVIGIIGLDALYKPLDDEFVFQPELFGDLTGLPMGAPITLKELASLAAHPRGLFKGAPDRARRIIVLNKGDVLDEPPTEADLRETFSGLSFPLRILIASLLPDTGIERELTIPGKGER